MSWSRPGSRADALLEGGDFALVALGRGLGGEAGLGEPLDEQFPASMSSSGKWAVLSEASFEAPGEHLLEDFGGVQRSFFVDCVEFSLPGQRRCLRSRSRASEIDVSRGLEWTLRAYSLNDEAVSVCFDLDY